MEKFKVILDAGHGRDTAGKRSPDGRLLEYAYAREIAVRLERELKARGYDAQRIVPEENDICLKERCERANRIYAATGKKAILVSIHCNAAGADGKWHDARGWSAYVSRNASKKSKELACRLIDAAETQGLKVRRYSQDEPYWTQNLAICRDTNCPAVLTENLFQDNREDVDYLLSEKGKRTIVELHVEGIMAYLGKV
jgi:N-acetylmuramoyl-L-alanine amidase